ncbi:MAG TPA: ABC transporter permease [Puia sp.]|nr:ABC transporter permease [Puia sp.]
MFRNYFKTAWRSLARGRSFSFINITGLAVGMAGAVLILLWISNELSFDRFHRNKDRLYRIYSMTEIPGEKHQTIDQVSQPLGPALQQEFPEVEAFSRVANVDGFLFTAGGRSFTGIEGSVVDTAFFRLFSFPLVAGAVRGQLLNVHSIVITERLAVKLFGNTDALGKTIRLDSVDNFTVTGVLKDLPPNTQFSFDYLLPWAYWQKIGWYNDNWISNNMPTYVLLRPDVDVAEFNAKIRDLTRVKTGRNDLWVHFAYPLTALHLHSTFDDGRPSGGRIVQVRIFVWIAVFILVIACINFINLSTARSEQRAKEVGIRKVAGAGRFLLIGQFITEAFLTTCIAGAMALLIVQLVLPEFSTLIGTTLRVPFESVAFWLWALGFLVVTSLLAGSYPAFYLSAFKPVGIFRKEFRRPMALFSPRRVLVVLQFTFAIVLIISTLIIREQLQYAENRDTGYARNALIYLPLEGEIGKNYPLIRQELLSSGVAVGVSKNMLPMIANNVNSWGFRWDGELAKDTTKGINLFSEDADLVRTAGLQLVAGRDIDIYTHPTDSFAVVLNETAVKWMGFKDPIGQVIREPYDNQVFHVVGVVKDYVVGSPYSKVPPVLILGPSSFFNVIHFKLNPARSTADNLVRAKAIFTKYNPAYPFDYEFSDQRYAALFRHEQRTRTMSGLFAGLTIFISCLGLFGLSAFVAESRVKEIGVRKVLGASVAGIARLLSVEFVRLVVISLVIATPLAWYAMNRWLSGYNYRISLRWETFAVAGVLAIVIALATVSFQAVRAAMANPVKSLRSE